MIIDKTKHQPFVIGVCGKPIKKDWTAYDYYMISVARRIANDV